MADPPASQLLDVTCYVTRWTSSFHHDVIKIRADPQETLHSLRPRIFNEYPGNLECPADFVFVSPRRRVKKEKESDVKVAHMFPKPLYVSEESDLARLTERRVNTMLPFKGVDYKKVSTLDFNVSNQYWYNSINKVTVTEAD